MSKAIPIEDLEASIEQFYERYSAKKVAVAAFMVGVFTIGFSYVAYALTSMAIVAILTSGVVGFLSVNLTMIFVVPPKKKLEESRELICAAIREPSRIKEIDRKGVKLADKSGIVHSLNGPELEVWTNKVVPYFMQTQSTGQPVTKEKTERKFTASERKYIEERRREVLEIEKKIDEERKAMDKERREMDARIAELRELEKLANEKLAKADKVDIEKFEKANAEREAEFKKREAEIAALQEKLEREAKDLEERSQYVANVEDSLVDRLNQLSTREAGIEQGEINAGLRKD